MTNAEIITLLGERGSVGNITSAQRSAVRGWLKGLGCRSSNVDGLTLEELTEVYNDTTDTMIDRLKASPLAETSATTTTTTTTTAKPVGPPPVEVEQLGLFRGPVESLVDYKLSGFSPMTSVDPKEVKKHVDDRLDTIRPLLEAAEKDASIFSGTRAGIVASMATDPIMAKIAPYYKPGVDIGTNVMLCSPPSFGKSRTIRKLSADYDVFLEHGCSGDMDEIATMLGNPCPDGSGGFVMFDGVLTQAVRAASTGKTVLLMLDEVLRLPETPQEWLLTFLTGFETAGSGRKYRLRTRKVMPDGSLEVLECDAGNLHIISATNLGMLRPVEAFWSRWLKQRIEWSEELAISTAESIQREAGISPSKLPKKFAAIMGEARQALKAGTIAMPVDFRLLKVACQTAPDATEESVVERLKDYIQDQVTLWDCDTGDMESNSKEVVKKWVAKLTL